MGTFEPFANLAYVSLDTNDFTEEGGAAALRGRGMRTEATFTTVGFHAAVNFSLGPTNVTFDGTLGWRHAFGDIIPTAALSFAGSDFFAIAGVPIAEDAAVIEAGLGLELAPNATLGVAYQGQIAAWREGGLEDQVLTAGGIASENDHAHGAPARHEGLGFSLGPPLTTQLLSSSAS